MHAWPCYKPLEERQSLSRLHIAFSKGPGKQVLVWPRPHLYIRPGLNGHLPRSEQLPLWIYFWDFGLNSWVYSFPYVQTFVHGWGWKLWSKFQFYSYTSLHLFRFVRYVWIPIIIVPQSTSIHSNSVYILCVSIIGRVDVGGFVLFQYYWFLSKLR